MGGILTVVKPCAETQLDYSYYADGGEIISIIVSLNEKSKA